MSERIAVIGGGITGLFSAMYLAQAGFETSLFEKGELASETSDKFHGMIHSGARYAVNDMVSARECISENRILSGIASSFIDSSDGYFLAMTDQEAEFGDRLESGCHTAGIPCTEEDVDEFLSMEPHVSRDLKRVMKVPDMVVHAFDFAAAVAAEARMLGASIATNTEVTRIIADENTVTGLELSVNGAKNREKFDLVVNAAGPFTWNVLRESKIPSPEIMPSLGSMLVYDGRVTNSVLNRMRMPSDGDIIVPYGSSSILGTMATVVEDASSYTVDQEEIDSLQEEGNRMVPSLEKMPLKRVYSSVRPLISDRSGDPRSASRSFDIFDHSRDGYSGLLTITGGKYTTGRIIGQETARKVCEIFGSKFNPRNPELDTSFQRFRDSGMMLHADIYDMVKSRSETMDAERLIPGMALAVMASVSNRKSVK